MAANVCQQLASDQTYIMFEHINGVLMKMYD